MIGKINVFSLTLKTEGEKKRERTVQKVTDCVT